MSTPFPKTYVIPRRGELVPVTVEDGDQLRTLRTELELLRRLQRLVDSNRFVAIPRSEAKYTSDDRRELEQILRDAGHELVGQTLASVDREFGDLRQDILMSTLNEQAETLAHAAAESGALDAVSTEALEVRADSAPSVEDALVAAEVELAKVLALQAAQSPLGTPAEIGSRLGKLASIQGDEVNGRWDHAEKAPHEVITLRTRVQQTAQNTADLFAQVFRLQEETEIARDDAEVARREAKLLRDDARRAKVRAEAAAAACSAMISVGPATMTIT